MSPTNCYFCQVIADGKIELGSSLAVARFDNYPISPGHALILPRRHVADWFDLTTDEQTQILSLAQQMRDRLAAERQPDGWNMGLNIGAAGGQTIGHVHLHLIPRYAGDQADPRGGVRWIFPERAVYWKD